MGILCDQSGPVYGFVIFRLRERPVWASASCANAGNRKLMGPIAEDRHGFARSQQRDPSPLSSVGM